MDDENVACINSRILFNCKEHTVPKLEKLFPENNKPRNQVHFHITKYLHTKYKELPKVTKKTHPMMMCWLRCFSFLFVYNDCLVQGQICNFPNRAVSIVYSLNLFSCAWSNIFTGNFSVFSTFGKLQTIMLLLYSLKPAHLLAQTSRHHPHFGKYTVMPNHSWFWDLMSWVL